MTVNSAQVPSPAGNVLKMVIDPKLLEWMRDSDPALRWRVERELARRRPEGCCLKTGGSRGLGKAGLAIRSRRVDDCRVREHHVPSGAGS